MAQEKVITTPRLILRAARSTDLNDFHEFFSNGEVMKYWSTAPHAELEQTQRYLDTMMSSPTNGHLDFVISLSSTQKVIGKAGIWSISKSEIGFMLHRSYWGKGYMAESLTALIPKFWEERVEKVVADVDPRNDGSMGILKRFDFRETGREERTGEVGGVWYDSVYLELERPAAERT